MQMTIESVQGKVPVTILALRGDLDASNFESVIAKAKEILAAFPATAHRESLVRIADLVLRRKK